MTSRRPRALAFVVLAAACWGAGTVLSKEAVAELPPLTLLAVQLIVSVAVLSLAAAWTRQTVRGTDRRLVLLGALNPGLAYALSLVGLTLITASASVLIWAMEPILILLLAGVVLSERPGASMVGLSLVAFAGLAIAIGTGAGESALLGVALSLAGVLCCVFYGVATRRWIEEAPSILMVVVLQDLVALAVVAVALVVATLAGSSVLPPSLSQGGVVSALASGVLYYGAAYLLYVSALRILPVSIAAISFYLVPVFGIAAASVAGERLTWIQWVGAGATIAAVLAVGYLDVRRPSEPQAIRIQ